MTGSLFNSWRSAFISWLYAFMLLVILIALAGKQAVAWTLMKLYEFFIQKNPVR
jgi:hypothetical protein